MAVVGRVLLIPKGDYSGSTVYNSLDWVRDNGAAWVCKVDGTQAIAPPTLPTTSNANWQLLSADGSVSGSVAWNSVTHKPFSLVDTDDFEVDANDVLKLKNGSGGDTVSWSQIQTSTGATNIADITINGTTQHVYAPTGGGGASIDDTTTALDKTWSSSKINSELGNKADSSDIPTISVAGHGTASASVTHEQQITINSVAHDIDGTKYMEYTANSATFTFTNAAILTTSVIDVYTDTWGDNPSTVTASSGSCSVTFASASTRTVRIYIR